MYQCDVFPPVQIKVRSSHGEICTGDSERNMERNDLLIASPGRTTTTPRSVVSSRGHMPGGSGVRLSVCPVKGHQQDDNRQPEQHSLATGILSSEPYGLAQTPWLCSSAKREKKSEKGRKKISTERENELISGGFLAENLANR